MTDNQPRYTTKRMHDEITKAKAYGIELALEAVAAFRCDTGEFLPRDQVIAAIRSMKEAPSDRVVGSDDWFNQIVSFLVKHDMLDAREEYDINEVMAALADNYEPNHARPSVKQLQWYSDPGAFPFKTWGAQSPFGRFIIEEVSASDSPIYEVRYTPHHLVTIKDGLPEAKEAAQADYERRIMSAIASTEGAEG